MNPDARNQSAYASRQTEVARRVLVDVGQVLASFADCLVVVGGWTPDLLLPPASMKDESHVGSIDVDLALDASKLNDGRYAELIQLLLDTKRYRHGRKDFQLLIDIDLKDGERPVEVELEFLAPKEVKLKKRKPKLLNDFRVLQVEAASVAFLNPETIRLEGKSARGALNTVTLRVASLADFLVMKAHAIGGRDKPKDSYDLCYCLDRYPDGIQSLAENWRNRQDGNIDTAVAILREKFARVESFGPQQLVEFHDPIDEDVKLMLARRAYELVQKLLRCYDER